MAVLNKLYQLDAANLERLLEYLSSNPQHFSKVMDVIKTKSRDLKIMLQLTCGEETKGDDPDFDAANGGDQSSVPGENQ